MAQWETAREHIARITRQKKHYSDLCQELSDELFQARNLLQRWSDSLVLSRAELHKETLKYLSKTGRNVDELQQCNP